MALYFKRLSFSHSRKPGAARETHKIHLGKTDQGRKKKKGRSTGKKRSGPWKANSFTIGKSPTESRKEPKGGVETGGEGREQRDQRKKVNWPMSLQQDGAMERTRRTSNRTKLEEDQKGRGRKILTNAVKRKRGHMF